MAKLLACDVAVAVTQAAQQLHGGWGYSEEDPISRLVVDALVLPIFEGVKPILELKVIGRGLLAAAPNPPVNIWVLVLTVPVVAILGDQCAYFIGRRIGPALFDKEDSRFFKKRYVEESHAFFEKHGPKTIILARFVPIVRTYAPVLAGVSYMSYPVFLSYNIIGGILWGSGMTALGYFLGNVPFVKNNFELVILLIVFLSILPGITAVGRNVLRRRGGLPEETEKA